MKKNKNKIRLILLALCLLMSLSGCSIARQAKHKATSKLSSILQGYAMKTYKKDAESRLGNIQLPDDVVIDEEDDFIPGLGDGCQKMIITLPEGYDLSTYIDDTWMPCPMSENAKKVVDGYEETVYDETYGEKVTVYDTKTDDFIPSDIENGYYRFISYVHDTGWEAAATDESIGETFVENISQVYAVMVYDSDAGKIYMYYLSW